MLDIKAKFPATVSAYMQSDARTRHIVGPFRSGKSSGSVVDLIRRSAMQKRGPDGYRRSRWMVVRNTMPELRDTTIKTFLNWFPSGTIGYMKETGKTYFIQVDDIRAEIMFRALDDAGDVANLLSLEITGAYLNEVREISREIIEGIDGRIGQYPAMKDGGPSWYGIWADTNPPEERAYLHSMYEKRDPDDPKKVRDNAWAVFKQPAAVIKDAIGEWHTNPLAENLENLIPGYYEKQLDGKTDEYIRVNLAGEYGRSKGGRPVHEMYNTAMHVAKSILVPNKANLLLISMDFGLTPAMVLKQQDALGRVLTFDSIATFNMGLERAIETRLLPLLRQKYDGFDIAVTGDPSGGRGSDADEVSCVDVIQRYRRRGMGKVKLAWSNNPIHRQGATDFFLSRLVGMGLPAYQICPGEGTLDLRLALGGNYRFKKFKDGRPSSDVEKNEASHTGEASEYGDMWFHRGERRKAELKERGIVPVVSTPNPYATPR